MASTSEASGPVELVVDDQAGEERLDRFLADRIEGITRSQIKRAIDRGLALVDGRAGRASLRLRAGQRIVFEPLPPEPSKVEPEEMPLDIPLEDDHLLVINKSAGVVVHPAAGNWQGTLVAGVLAHCGRLDGGEPIRPGVVHRLDKDTSGLLVVAKTLAAHDRLARQFHDHTVGRRYLALLRGVPKSTSGTLRTPYGRHPRHRVRFSSKHPAEKTAITHFEVLETFGKSGALVACTLETGRTHQVRVHMADSGHPVLGDELYGGRTGGDRRFKAALRRMDRQALHAERLAFDHPATGERVDLHAPPPPDFASALEALRGAP